MIQGTTPTHTFVLPFQASLVQDVMVTYTQNHQIILEKHSADCIWLDNAIQIHLTQNDTFAFSHLHRVKIEFKILTFDNKVLAKNFHNIPVEEALNKEVFPT